MLMTNAFLSPRRVAGFTGLLLMLLTTEANAGSLDAPAVPSVAASAMFTLTDLYNRLNAGTPGAKRSGPFAEPTAAPGATGYTLDQIMALMPVVDDVNGATTANVLSGKTFWGLTSGQWKLQTGAVPAGANVIGTNGSLSMSIPDGLYSGGKFAIAGDTNLSTANIKSGVTIFGVNGAYPLSAVPKTGQTTSYDTGDDGDLQKGVALPSPRFNKNVNTVNDTGIGGGIAGNGICDGTETCNGTVTDNLTGLIWLTNANCANTPREWAVALGYVVSLNSVGTMNSNDCSDTSNGGSHQTDWRLPNVRELNTLIDFGSISPALSLGHPFTGVQLDYYWSSTGGTSPFTGNKWGLDPNYGYTTLLDETTVYYVWPVRGGL